MVNGPAAGSGLDMALQSDVRIGCENTRLVTYHQRGQIIENGWGVGLTARGGSSNVSRFADARLLRALM
jgi:enoyl-CoA hydratase/carnithine racemase